MLQPVYHCGVGQPYAHLKAVSDQMFIDGGGYIPADKSVIVYVHGQITDTTGTQLFPWPSWPDGGAFSLTVQGYTGNTTDQIICTTTSTTINASNFTFKNLKFTGGVRVPWFLGTDNSGHDNCFFDNAYQSHYETTNGFMRNNIFINVAYAALSGYSTNPAKPMIIEDNIVYGTPGGYSAFGQKNTIIRRNYFKGGARLITCQSVGPSINCKIYNNFLTEGTGSGVYFFASGGLNQGYEIYNNTFYNNTYGIEANYLNNEQNLLKNNLFFVKAGQFAISFDAVNRNQFLNYNFYDIDIAGNCANIHNGTIWETFQSLALLKAAYPAYEIQGSQGSADFILPGSTSPQDYKIKATSAAKDMGLNLAAVFTTDYNNKSRPKANGWDAGMFEEPTIALTGAILTDYAIVEGEATTARFTATGTIVAAFVSVNGQVFSMIAKGGGLYEATIYGWEAGITAGSPAVFTAWNDDFIATATAPSSLVVTKAATYDIAAIETQIALILGTISGLTIYKYEPKEFSALPAASLFYDGFTQEQTEAVSFTITHKWTLRIYCRLHDAEITQTQLKDLTGKVLAALKLSLRFGGSVLFGFAPSGTTGAILDRNTPVLVEEISLTAMKEED